MQTVLAYYAERPKIYSASITRPANTTAYAAGDAISDATGDALFEIDTSIDGVDYPQDGVIVSAQLISSANQGTALEADVFFFTATPGTVADNSAIDWADAKLTGDDFLGLLTFDTWSSGNPASGASGNAVSNLNEKQLRYITDSNGKIYAQAVARNAYTPVSGEVLTLKITVITNRALKEIG